MDFIQNHIYPFFKTVQLSDVVDILIVAVIIYNIIKHFRNTRAAQLLKGIAIIFALTYIAEWLQLNVISFILENAMQVGFIALIIIFQPELRRGLEHMGRSKFGKWFSVEKEEVPDVVGEVCKAAENMAKSHTGALVVFERETILDDFLTGGTAIDATVTAELIENIFVPNTPLHDGAIVLRDHKIYKASCVLPLSGNKNLSNELGTRHRAALGITEQTDCICLVVSEETGKISVMEGGDMVRNLSINSLHQLLNKVLAPKEDMGANVRKNIDYFKLQKMKKKEKNTENEPFGKE